MAHEAYAGGGISFGILFLRSSSATRYIYVVATRLLFIHEWALDLVSILDAAAIDLIIILKVRKR